jgi:hypothetical protein
MNKSENLENCKSFIDKAKISIFPSFLNSVSARFKVYHHNYFNYKISFHFNQFDYYTYFVQNYV